jgi:GTP-binding protein EngB required for normal cell division
MSIDLVKRLRIDLGRIHKSLAGSSLLPFSPEEQLFLLNGAQQLLDKLDHLAQGQLTVGFLGGTGVGKSTIMNALAGKSIASTSHRRPHTHQVLVYRHAAGLLPNEVAQGAVAYREITHEAAPIRHIILCDLPDYDSLMEENRAQVLNFLEHLDVLVWVSSPEKYADAGFYEFLELAPKAQQNFYFALNKADVLFQDKDANSAYASLTTMMNQFRQHVIHQGVDHPLMFAVAAREALDEQALSPWNQFAALRHQIFQQRDLKEIVAIKAANIDEEVQRFLRSMQTELFSLENMQETLAVVIQELEHLGPEWRASGRNTLAGWLETSVKPRRETQQTDPSLLVGPGRSLAVLRQEWAQLLRTSTGGPSAAAGSPRASAVPFPAEVADPLAGHLRHLENRLVNRFLRQSAAPHFIARLKQDLSVQEAWERFTEKAANILETSTTHHPHADQVPGAGVFRLGQYLAYSLCFGLFFWALPGQDVWSQFLQQPGLTRLLALVLAMVDRLFSPQGLAALLTLFLLQFFLAVKFHRRYKKLLQRRNQKFIDSLKDELGALWDDTFFRLLSTLKQFHTTMQEQTAAITELRSLPLRE